MAGAKQQPTFNFDRIKDNLLKEIGRWEKLEEAGFPLWERPLARGAQLIEDAPALISYAAAAAKHYFG